MTNDSENRSTVTKKADVKSAMFGRLSIDRAPHYHPPHRFRRSVYGSIDDNHTVQLKSHFVIEGSSESARLDLQNTPYRKRIIVSRVFCLRRVQEHKASVPELL